jgi:hypothetical protein
LKGDYEAKIQLFLNDYKSMQQEMLMLKQQVLSQPALPAPVLMGPMVDVGAIEDVWRLRLEEVGGEREVLIEKVSLWERRY